MDHRDADGKRPKLGSLPTRIKTQMWMREMDSSLTARAKEARLAAAGENGQWAFP